MKKPLILALLIASNSAYAVDVNPFMSAKDREEALTEERKAQEAKLKDLVAQALEELKSANKTLPGSEPGSHKNSAQRDLREGGSAKPNAEPAKPVPAEPSDFAIAGIKGKHILIRQMDNKSMIVGAGRKFWDNGEAYDATITDHETVKITRVSDGKVVFFGGVGSVFTPKTSSTSGMKGNGGNEL